VTSPRSQRRLGLGETEVEQLRPAARQHHIAGLDVPVDDPLPVSRVEGIGDLESEAQRLIERQRPLRQPIRQYLPLEILHDEVVHSVVMTGIEQGADVGMRELRDGLRFALESLTGLGRVAELRRQDLDRDGSLQPRIARPVDLSHSSGTELTEDFVRAEARAG
jgi:hypothetical protein